MRFCHIAPTFYLPLLADYDYHLCLAHLVERDTTYAQWYANLTRKLPHYLDKRSKTIILDNSAFELYKEGKPMYPTERLIRLGNDIKADYIVMSDYPNKDPQKTIDAAKQFAPKLRNAGFGTFFCPQSKIGDLAGLVDSIAWAAVSDHVDYIGISILAVPNAYGVEKDNKLQRFCSRWKFLRLLEQKGLLDLIVRNGKKIHMLGMVDGPNEIELVSSFLPYITSWDSSAAVWAGLNDILFDNSPTGLIEGKYEVPVDFNFKSAKNTAFAVKNMQYIDGLIMKGI